ncbi:MAG TPA: hypothetical protein VEI82_15565, partial [Myxococcota bacterium]|nr:hypothetical protein [Myxococcota bacterium]
MSRARACAALLAALTTACVTRAEHEAALARMRSLEYQRAQRDEEFRQLELRNAALHAVGSRLASERSSLDQQARDLLGQVESLRGEQERVQSALEDERRESAERE